MWPLISGDGAMGTHIVSVTVYVPAIVTGKFHSSFIGTSKEETELASFIAG